MSQSPNSTEDLRRNCLGRRPEWTAAKYGRAYPVLTIWAYPASASSIRSKLRSDARVIFSGHTQINS